MAPFISLQHLIRIEDGIVAMNPDGTKKWFHYNRYANDPVIGPDGTIYLTRMGDLDTPSDFYALNPDGSEKWKFQTSTAQTEYFGTPLIGADGIIYVATTSTIWET